MGQSISVGFGTREIQIELEDAVQVVGRTVGEPHASGNRDTDESIRDRVAYALMHPAQFLGIDQLLTPGDRLAIALEPGLPRPDQILQGVLQVVETCEPAQISVVISEWTDTATREAIRQSLPERVELLTHRLDDRGSHSYLGADEEAEPIRLHVALGESDVVLPISVMRPTDPLTGGASSDAIYPGLADQGQWRRLIRRVTRSYEQPNSLTHGTLATQTWAENQSRQVRWTLGVQLVAAVEISALGGVGRVLAGTPESLQGAVRSLDEESRSSGEEDPADVVVVCVEGGPTQQTLANLARAALIGQRHATLAGSIVVVSDLDSLRLAEADRDAAPVELADDDSERDAAEAASREGTISQNAFARRLLSTVVNRVDNNQRYLLWSRCPAEAAEAFGFGVIENEAALARLINQHPRCHVIRVAQA